MCTFYLERYFVSEQYSSSKVVEVNAPETRKQSRTMFVKNVFDMFPIIEKKGNGAYIHDKKSLYAQDKRKSKGTSMLLMFFISNSQ